MRHAVSVLLGMILPGFLMLASGASPVLSKSMSAEALKAWSEWDRSCHQLSVSLRKKESYAPFHAVCTRAPRGSVLTYRHLYGLIHESFHAESKADQHAALALLETYACENRQACEALSVELDILSKAFALPLRKSDPKHFSRLQKLRDQAKLHLTKTPPETKGRTGLCQPGQDAVTWFERYLTLYCPRSPQGVPVGTALCIGDPSKGPCFQTEAFKFDVETESHQTLLSSSFLSELRQPEIADCTRSWTLSWSCGGASPFSLKIQCEPKKAARQGESRFRCLIPYIAPQEDKS